jgi:cobalt transporter subunit CbtA
MFKRIAQTAGFTGLLAALLLTLLQSFWVAPLILQAETWEKPAAGEAHEHAEGAVPGHAHVHDAEAWEPEDGWQRVLSTTGGNLVVAVGFALMLAALYTLRAPASAREGILWGLAGYAVFVVAPTLGLPPELPGTVAADLTQRQIWWASTAASTGAGLALMVFARHWLLKALGAMILVVPHLVGAPQPAVHSALAPEALQTQFKLASLLTNAAFWVALGWIAAWLFRRSEPGATHSGLNPVL